MLKEEQAAELLARCEKIVGKKLIQTRGNLRSSKTRAAAVWELLVLEATSEIGSVEYEPRSGGSPDIRLRLAQGRDIWIEVAFLYPRFWKGERKSRVVADWIFEEAKRKGIPQHKITYQLDGDQNNPAGPVRQLPELHEKKNFLKNSGVSEFLSKINSSPNEKKTFVLSGYSISLSYEPDANGPYLSGGGLIQEAPKNVQQHAIYRVLKGKASQHKIGGPRIICIGSDQSPVLSTLTGPGNPRLRDAVAAAFRENHSLSGTIVVRIESATTGLYNLLQRRARSEFFANLYTKEPLTDAEWKSIRKLNFNKWKYTYALEKWEQKNCESFRRVGGSLTTKCGRMGVKIEVPCNILIDSLAGKTNLIKTYGLAKNDPLVKYLDDGWVIQSCKFMPGNIEVGESPKVVLSLAPPPSTVYWPRKKDD